MKNVQMAALWIMILFFIGIFIWTIWPPPMIEESYPIDFSNPLFLDQTCIKSTDLDEFIIRLAYPGHTNAGQLIFIQIFADNGIAEGGFSDPGCLFSIEMHLDLKNGFILPANRIVQALSDSSTQIFRFEIQPVKNSRVVNGRIWAYMIINSETSQAVEALPLLVIPIEIAIRSFFGIPILFVRMFSVTSILVLLLVKLKTRRPG